MSKEQKVKSIPYCLWCSVRENATVHHHPDGHTAMTGPGHPDWWRKWQEAQSGKGEKLVG